MDRNIESFGLGYGIRVQLVFHLHVVSFWALKKVCPGWFAQRIALAPLALHVCCLGMVCFVFSPHVADEGVDGENGAAPAAGEVSPPAPAAAEGSDVTSPTSPAEKPTTPMQADIGNI